VKQKYLLVESIRGRASVTLANAFLYFNETGNDIFPLETSRCGKSA